MGDAPPGGKVSLTKAGRRRARMGFMRQEAADLQRLRPFFLVASWVTAVRLVHSARMENKRAVSSMSKAKSHFQVV